MNHEQESSRQLTLGLFKRKRPMRQLGLDGKKFIPQTSDIIINMNSDANNETDQLNLGLHKEIDTTNTEQATQEKKQDNSSLLSRRKFLIGTGLAAVGFGFGYLTKFRLPDLGSLFPSPEKEPQKGTMILGENETSLQNEMLGYMNYVPDGPITYWTTAEGKRRYLLTGGDMNQDKKWDGNATYMIETDGTKSLKEVIESGNITADSFTQVWGPDVNVEYRKYYSGITSVLQTDKDNPDHLFGITHNENRSDRNASATFTATIGLVESQDGGLTWEDRGALIHGEDPQTPGKDVSGAGQPSAIYNEKDGFTYILYVDWTRVNVHHPDQIYLARIKPNAVGESTMLQYWTKKGFGFPEDGLKPVIPVPEGSNMVYAALPHLSWNKDLNQYMCEGECDTGFWMATSPDLLSWSKPEIVYDFTKRGGKPHSILKVGEKWDSYPTALSESEPNSHTTNKKGVFYHSSGDNVVPHVPATVDFEIK